MPGARVPNDLQDLRPLEVALFETGDVRLKDLLNELGFQAVHGQLEPLAQELVGYALEVRLQDRMPSRRTLVA
jgi:hypothetical protein